MNTEVSMETDEVTTGSEPSKIAPSAAEAVLQAKKLLVEVKKQQEFSTQGGSVKSNEFLRCICNKGMLMDKLQLSDPSLLANHPQLQRRTLFESIKSKIKGDKSDQSYMLSLLVEFSDWKVILSTINWLLSEETTDPTNVNKDSSLVSVNPSTVLDFLWTVIHAPSIWQGREKKSTNEPVMQLNSEQICRIVSYVVAATAEQRFNNIHKKLYIGLSR